ncbi:WD40 repeat domain-containing protein [Campylobacter geochelonis]|uniref:WD40 repeat domain-containing protein n=1 Tax=Campylobacter geochelonis TaxID=1780362 RepID=UPI0007706E18|nr:hypothetical protein [Campylobacter geochelonis]CZE51178.1 carbon-nitrogen family hydrolase [Campylobacter geochelonis]
MRVLICFFASLSLLFSAELLNVIETNSNVMNINLKKNLLYISTDGGEMQIYDLDSNQFSKSLTIPTIKTYFSDEQKAKIFSTDELNGVMAMLGEGDYGKKVLFIYKDEKLKSLNLENQSIKKALFIDDKTMVFASLSNEIYFYDLETKSVTYSHKFSTSALNDMEISLDKKIIALGCESGKVYLFDVKAKKISKTLDLHKDNIYDVAISQNGVVVSGSADKNAGLVANEKAKMLNATFLVYAVGVSQDGTKAAFMSDENSDITIFNTQNLSTIDVVKTEQSTINGILFYKNNMLISSAYEKDIKIWRY